MHSTEAVKRTALFDRHVALGARMGNFAGYEMPLWYEGIKAEHLNVRNHVGIFDLSHMGEFYVKGTQAFDLVQYLTCNDLRRIGDGQCQYTLFPTPDGGVVDDLIVYQINPEHYLLVVNANNIAKDFQWVVEHNRFDCDVVNRSDELTLVAVQGPNTESVLKDFGIKAIAKQRPFTFRRLKIEKRPITIAATGYTGERGFELIIDNEHATWLWDSLMDIGEKYHACPVGLGARDTLRFEMAYSLYGNELAEDISVLEANLGWTVRFGPEFLGREFLVKQQQEGVKRVIAGVVVERNHGAPRHGASVYSTDGEQIGYITSGSFSPSLNQGIALVLVDPKYSEPGMNLLVDIRNKKVQASVIELPFYRPTKASSK